MATSDPVVPAVSITDAVRDAIEHTRRNLFPIRVERWLVLGFLAFLDQCGRTLNGGGGGSGGGGGGHDWPGEGRGFGEGVTEAVNTATAWLSAHAVEVTLGVVLGLILIAGIMAVVLWINARGTFMYLDNVASGRAEICRPWSEHAGPGPVLLRLALRAEPGRHLRRSSSGPVSSRWPRSPSPGGASRAPPGGAAALALAAGPVPASPRAAAAGPGLAWRCVISSLRSS